MAASAFQPVVSASLLADANATKNPGSDQVSEYVLAPGTLTNNRILTLGVTGASDNRLIVRIVRRDQEPHTYTVKDDAGNVLYTFASSPTFAVGASFYFDLASVHWKFLSVYPVTAAAGGVRGTRGTDLEFDEDGIAVPDGEIGRCDFWHLTSIDDNNGTFFTFKDAYGEVPDGGEITFFNDTGSPLIFSHMAGAATSDLLPFFLMGGALTLADKRFVSFRRDDVLSAWIQINQPYTLTSAEYAKLTALRNPNAGSNLTNADQTLQPGTDKVSQYTQAITLTANRTKTLGTTSVVTGTLVRIVREDTAAQTLIVVNGGGAGGTLFTFAASPTEKQGATFFFNGSDWVLVGFEYLVS